MSAARLKSISWPSAQQRLVGPSDACGASDELGARRTKEVRPTGAAQREDCRTKRAKALASRIKPHKSLWAADKRREQASKPEPSAVERTSPMCARQPTAANQSFATEPVRRCCKTTLWVQTTTLTTTTATDRKRQVDDERARETMARRVAGALNTSYCVAAAKRHLRELTEPVTETTKTINQSTAQQTSAKRICLHANNNSNKNNTQFESTHRRQTPSSWSSSSSSLSSSNAFAQSEASSLSSSPKDCNIKCCPTNTHSPKKPHPQRHSKPQNNLQLKAANLFIFYMLICQLNDLFDKGPKSDLKRRKSSELDVNHNCYYYHYHHHYYYHDDAANDPSHLLPRKLNQMHPLNCDTPNRAQTTHVGASSGHSASRTYQRLGSSQVHLSQQVLQHQCRSPSLNNRNQLLNYWMLGRVKQVPSGFDRKKTDHEYLFRHDFMPFGCGALQTQFVEQQLHKRRQRQQQQQHQQRPLRDEGYSFFPKIVLASATSLSLAEETCTDSSDCGNRDKICHENKCMCEKDRPVEVQDRCLPLALIRDQCSIDEQCLGNSRCIDGICDCGPTFIGLTNPSTKTVYCHPKRGLFQECNYDSQCPENAFCSTKKHGCLCQNGFGPTTVSYDGNEVVACLPKLCTNSSTCESEYHQCEDNKCKCLATHFDPTTAKCYKFGSTGGQPSDGSALEPTNADSNESDDNSVSTVFKDLTVASDKLWLILLILILSILILLIVVLVLFRKNCLSHCCWTTNKNEYEPNNKNGTLKNGSNKSFDKSSINNKSFRKKSSETDDDSDDAAADRSSLVAGSKENNDDKKDKKSKQTRNGSRVQTPSNQYVSVNISDDTGGQQSNSQIRTSPLASSTSTPV